MNTTPLQPQPNSEGVISTVITEAEIVNTPEVVTNIKVVKEDSESDTLEDNSTTPFNADPVEVVIPEKIEVVPPAIKTTPNTHEKSGTHRTATKVRTTTKQTEVKKGNRKVASIAFSNSEWEYIEKVFEARNAHRNKDGKPLSDNMHQMLRQAVNFALNFEEGWYFSRPEDLKPVYIN